MAFTQEELFKAYEQTKQERQAEYDIAFEDSKELEKLVELKVLPKVKSGWGDSIDMHIPFKLKFYMVAYIDSYGPTGSKWYKEKRKEATKILHEILKEENKNKKFKMIAGIDSEGRYYVSDTFQKVGQASWFY